MSDLPGGTGLFWNLPQDINGNGAQFDSIGETEDVLWDWGLAFDILRGVRRPPIKLTFQQVRKSKMYDLLWAGIPHVIPVSSLLVDILKAEGATGWSTYPIALVDRDGAVIHGYHGLSVHGTAGRPQWQRSRKFLEEPILPGGRRSRMLKGIWFDLKTWDGSDLFLLKGTCHLMGTDRIVRAMKKGRVRGIEFTRQSDFVILEIGARRRSRSSP